MNIHIYYLNQLSKAGQSHDVFELARQFASESFVNRVLIFSRCVKQNQKSNESPNEIQRVSSKVWLVRCYGGKHDNWQPGNNKQEVMRFASNAVHFSEINQLRPSLVQGDCLVAQHVAEYYGVPRLVASPWPESNERSSRNGFGLVSPSDCHGSISAKEPEAGSLS